MMLRTTTTPRRPLRATTTTKAPHRRGLRNCAVRARVARSRPATETSPREREEDFCYADDWLGIEEIGPIFEKDADQPEFLQAVSETLQSIRPLLADDPTKAETFRRLLEPERVAIFRVPWIDDAGRCRVNRGYRVQFSSARGPYKGGLRFHPSVNLSILKFLALEQTFKNALTGMPLGSAKGGSDFDPKGKSAAEVMRFCQSFMTELHRHVGANLDVPAGDIGVGGREIGYLFGHYKRITGAFEAGVLTGKGLSYGGSHIRPEATGFGLVYFLEQMIQRRDVAPSLKGLRVALSGSGNVAQFAVEKLIDLGAIPQTLSDSNGTLFLARGFDKADLDKICRIKKSGGRLSDLSIEGAVYWAGEKPWALAYTDVALPCATQNELDLEDALALVKGGTMAVAEGANVPTTPDAIALLEERGVLFGPAKASNAGGVAVSALEMAQNAQQGQRWTRQEVDDQLKSIMKKIYERCEEGAALVGGSFRTGADVIGFLEVAEAMEAQGCV